MFLLEILNYDFMVRALIVGFFTAISTAILGNFVVAARQTMASGMLSHTALVGVGLGIFFELSPTLMSLMSTLIFALLLWWGSRKSSQAPEAISMLLIAGGLALTLLLVHLNKDNPVALETYLFGSILTITQAEMYLFVSLNLLIVMVLLVLWRPLLVLVFDKDFLGTESHKRFYEILFMLLIALMVGLGLKVIGGLLISGLLVIPVLTAQGFVSSFRGSVAVSLGLNVVGVLFGVVASFYVDVPASSAIILSLVILFIGGGRYAKLY